MNNYKFGIRAIHQKDICTAILEAKKNDFDVLEIHLSSPQFLPQNYTDAQLKRIRDFALKNNITLQTHSELGQSLIHADNILRTAEKQKLNQIIQFSRKIGSRSLTLHVGNAPGYFDGPGKRIPNDSVYTKLYVNLFQESLKHIISIAPKDLFICIENADNFTVGYQKILAEYLKLNKIFLTLDIMKCYSHKLTGKLREDQWKFFKKNADYVRNIHISGPSHAGLQNSKMDFIPFLKLLQGKNIPAVIEIVSLVEAIKAKKIIQDLGL